MPLDPDQAATVDRITRQFTDEGRLIEAGWQTYRLLVLPATASAVQVSETRKAFFAGAQHLFTSILSVVSDDDVPSEEDLNRMALISAELDRFAKELLAEIGKLR